MPFFKTYNEGHHKNETHLLHHKNECLYFRVIAKGASGGHGRLSRKSSHGAVLTAIIRLNKGNGAHSHNTAKQR